ncbi:hypothetical protein RHOSPDRAFT_30971 [Rhodotorula sp. JG-1b]|nr:hypothetical protein RHOSPDRAFT_30971 [Rhodotorula sp. JG-1b]
MTASAKWQRSKLCRLFGSRTRRSPLAVVVALGAVVVVVVVVARLVLHLYAPSESPSNAAASKRQLLRFPQARPSAFSARLHYHHGAVQHVFVARPPRAEQDWQLLWEPTKPIAAIDIPPAGVVSFHRRDGSSGRLTAANASSFCLTDPQACTDWSRVRLDVSLEAALHHLRESDPASETSVCLPALQDPHVQDNSVTLVTQLSVSRLPRFDRLLNAWDGPISATIYLVDEHQDLVTLDSYLRELSSSSSSPSRRPSWSRLTLTILKPSFAPDRASVLKRLRYPINRLRNLAIQAASSSTYLLVIDVDFVPSPDMHRLLVNGAIPLIETGNRRRRSASSSPTLRRTAVVISTFALAVGYQDGEIPRTLEEVERLYRAEPQLAMLTDPNAGHGPTLPSRLFHQQQHSSSSYEVCYEPQWEPYYVLHRASHPLYDERFTDQGGDKQSHALVLNALGYEFRVLTNGGWVMHPPKTDLASEAWPAARRASLDLELEEANLTTTTTTTTTTERAERVGPDAAGEASSSDGGGRSEPPSLPPPPEDTEHFNLVAQRDPTRFRYFQDFLPEMETAWGKWTLRWPRGCSAGGLASGRFFGRARPSSVFGL